MSWGETCLNATQKVVGAACCSVTLSQSSQHYRKHVSSSPVFPSPQSTCAVPTLANIPGGNCFGASIRFQSIITAPEPSRTMLVSLLFGSVPLFLILSLCLNGRSSQKLKQSRVSTYLRRDTNFFLNLSILLPLFSNIFRNMILGDNLSFFFSCCDWPLYAAKLVCGSKNKV